MELGFYEFVQAPSTIFYIHPGNKLATIVGFNLPEVEYQVARDVAMQVAAMNPISVSRDEVPADVVAKELEIAKDKLVKKARKKKCSIRLLKDVLINSSKNRHCSNKLL